MFARRLVVTLFLGALLAGSTAGVSAAGGYKIPGLILFPPLVNVPLPLACHVQYDGGNTFLTCHNTVPNPGPPKDTKTAKFPDGPKGSCKLTAYSDGDVLILCRYKGEVVFT